MISSYNYGGCYIGQSWKKRNFIWSLSLIPTGSGILGSQETEVPLKSARKAAWIRMICCPLGRMQWQAVDLRSHRKRWMKSECLNLDLSFQSWPSLPLKSCKFFAFTIPLAEFHICFLLCEEQPPFAYLKIALPVFNGFSFLFWKGWWTVHFCPVSHLWFALPLK